MQVKAGDSFADLQFSMMDQTVVDLHASLLRTLRILCIVPFPPKDRRKAMMMQSKVPTTFRIKQFIVLAIFTFFAYCRHDVYANYRPLEPYLQLCLLIIDITHGFAFFFFIQLFRPENLLRFKILAKRLALSGLSFPEHLKSSKKRLRITLIVSISYGVLMEGIHLWFIYGPTQLRLPPVYQGFYHIRFVDIVSPLVVLPPLVIAEYLFFHEKFVEVLVAFVEKQETNKGDVTTARGTTRGKSKELQQIVVQTHNQSPRSANSSRSNDSGSKSMRKQNNTVSEAVLEAKQEVESLMHTVKTQLQIFVMIYIAVSSVVFFLMVMGLLGSIAIKRWDTTAATALGFFAFYVLVKVLVNSVKSLIDAKKKFSDAFENTKYDEER